MIVPPAGRHVERREDEILREVDSYRTAIRDAFEEGFALSKSEGSVSAGWERSEARQVEGAFALTRISVGAIVRELLAASPVPCAEPPCEICVEHGILPSKAIACYCHSRLVMREVEYLRGALREALTLPDDAPDEDIIDHAFQRLKPAVPCAAPPAEELVKVIAETLGTDAYTVSAADLPAWVRPRLIMLKQRALEFRDVKLRATRPPAEGERDGSEGLRAVRVVDPAAAQELGDASPLAVSRDPHRLLDLVEQLRDKWILQARSLRKSATNGSHRITNQADDQTLIERAYGYEERADEIDKLLARLRGEAAVRPESEGETDGE